MYMPESELLDQVVTDTERQAFTMLPALVEASPATRSAIAIQLADLMGNPGEFLQYMEGNPLDQARNEARLLRIFRENVELLVHKTWVNEADEKPKQILFEDLKVFIEDYRTERMGSAFRRFVSIARAIPSLLFGSAGRAPDFLEYAFRIDPKFGLFFWYVGELEKQMRSNVEIVDKDDLYRIETLLGAYILSCF